MPDTVSRLYEWENRLSSGGAGQIVQGQESIPGSNSPFTKGAVESFVDGSTGPVPANQSNPWNKIGNWRDTLPTGRSAGRAVTFSDFDTAEAYQQLYQGRPYTRSAGALPPAGTTSRGAQLALPPAGGTSLGLQYTYHPDGSYSYVEGNNYKTVSPPIDRGRYNLSGNAASTPTRLSPGEQAIQLGTDPAPKPGSSSGGSPSGSKSGSSGGLTYDRRGSSGGSTGGAGNPNTPSNSVSPASAAAQKRSTNSPVDARSRPYSSKAPAGSAVDIAPQGSAPSTSPRPSPARASAPTTFATPKTPSNPLGLSPTPGQKPAPAGKPVASNSASKPVGAKGAAPVPLAGVGRPSGGAALGTGANRALRSMAAGARNGIGPGLRANAPSAALGLGMMVATGTPPGQALGIMGGSLAGATIGGLVGGAIGGITGPLAPAAVPLLSTVGQLGGSFLGTLLGNKLFAPAAPLPQSIGQYIPAGAVPIFTGGQSPGVAYQLTITNRAGWGSVPGFATAAGPISIVSVGNGRWEAFSGASQTPFYVISQPQSYGAPAFSVARLDGQPDTGGNPLPPTSPAPPAPFTQATQNPGGTSPLVAPLAAGAGAGPQALLNAASAPPWQAPAPAANPFTAPPLGQSAPGRGPEQMPFAEPLAAAAAAAAAAPLLFPNFSPGMSPGAATSGAADPSTGVGGATKGQKTTAPQPQTHTRSRVVGSPSVASKSQPTPTPQARSWPPPTKIVFEDYTPNPVEAPVVLPRPADSQPRPTTAPQLPTSVPSPSPRDPFGTTAPATPTATTTGTGTNPSNAPATTPSTTPSPGPGTTPGTGTGTGGDICSSPCIVGLGQKADDAKNDMAEILRLLRKIYAAIGVDDFPLRHPLITGEIAGVQKNLVELIEWSVKNTDAVNGHWPLEVKVLGADGKDRIIKVKDQSEAIHELFGLLFTVAEDADAAVNIAARGVVETIQTKVSTVQSGQAIKAIIKFLGFNTKTTKDKIKISVSPSASGADNKLQNQEMADFLKPSEQLYPGIEYQDSKQLLIMLERMLEDVEIARAALYKPLKKDKKGRDTLTGEAIRREKLKSGADIYQEEWDLFIESLRKREANPDDKKKSKEDV